MKLTKGKPRKTAAKIVAYLLEIAGTREDAERAAARWRVRIRILDEIPGENEVYAVCPAEDVWEIMVWHDDYAPRLWAGGQPIPGDLMSIEQPPADVDTSFTEEKKPVKRYRLHPHGRRGRLRITDLRPRQLDEL
jgi:hypothetical protein